MTQQEALDILKTGRNVFLTGAAGSGKTYVLREYIKHVTELGAGIGITASTGIAATHMGGVTIHSWSGIGIRDSLHSHDIAEIAEKQHIRSKIKNASILVIDEISMLHHFRLDLVDAVLKEIKKSSEPFGGMQVVFCGDFFQLPPVQRAGEREALFAYHSPAWKECDLKVCYLTEQHRQNDMEYLNVLNAVRSGTVEEETYELLRSRFNMKSEFEPTKLYSHNRDVDSENDSELNIIGGKLFEYDMQSKGKHGLVEALKKSCLAPEILRLKEGAKVMFVKNNFDEGYVNGTLGIVTKCGYGNIQVRTIGGKVIDVPHESWRIDEDGKTKAEITQFPLRLAWAITIHKSQGMSLDAAEIDLSRSFEPGMGYVALSRVRSLSGLFLKGINDMALRVNEEVLAIDNTFQERSKKNSFHITTMGKEKINALHDAFEERIRTEKPKEKKLDTVTQTKVMLEEGKTIKDIAKERGLTVGTIFDHIEELRAEDPSFNLYHLQHALPKTKFKTIYSALKKVGVSEGGIYKLNPVKELLGPKYSYDDIRLVRLFM